MKTAIRMMVCVAMAATSSASFAREEDQASSAAGPEQVQAREGYAYAPTSGQDDKDVGAARGEPSRAAARKQDDTQAQNTETVEAYNHRRFLEEVWTRP